MASRLPGFGLTPAVAVGMGAAIAAVLRLPLAAIVLATLLTANSGTGDEPLIIVGVVVAYLVTLLISAPAPAASPAGDGAGRRTDAEPGGRRRRGLATSATAATAPPRDAGPASGASLSVRWARLAGARAGRAQLASVAASAASERRSSAEAVWMSSSRAALMAARPSALA